MTSGVPGDEHDDWVALAPSTPISVIATVAATLARAAVTLQLSPDAAEKMVLEGVMSANVTWPHMRPGSSQAGPRTCTPSTVAIPRTVVCHEVTKIGGATPALLSEPVAEPTAKPQRRRRRRGRRKPRSIDRDGSQSDSSTAASQGAGGETVQPTPTPLSTEDETGPDVAFLARSTARDASGGWPMLAVERAGARNHRGQVAPTVRWHGWNGGHGESPRVLAHSP